MGFWSEVGSGLKTVGKGSLQVLKIAGVIGVRGSFRSIPVVPTALEVVGLIEQAYGKTPGQGRLKKETAMLILSGALLAGGFKTDKKLLEEQYGPLVDGLVKMTNELELWDRVLPKLPGD